MTIFKKAFHLCLTPLLTACAFRHSIASAREVTGIAAKVNGRVITKNEVNLPPHPLSPATRVHPCHAKDRSITSSSIRLATRSSTASSNVSLFSPSSEFAPETASSRPYAIDQEIDRQVRSLYNNNRSEFNKALRQAGVTPAQHRRETEKKLIVQAMRSQQFKNADSPTAQRDCC